MEPGFSIYEKVLKLKSTIFRYVIGYDNYIMLMIENGVYDISYYTWRMSDAINNYAYFYNRINNKYFIKSNFI